VCVCVCEGGKQRMVQHLHGYLAGLSLLNNKTEDDQVISCLNECQEKLDLTSVDTLDDTVTHHSEPVALTNGQLTLNSDFFHWLLNMSRDQQLNGNGDMQFVLTTS